MERPSWREPLSIWGRCDRADPYGRTRSTAARDLREDLDDDAAVLRATVAGVVRRNWLRFTVGDHVDLVKRNLVLLVEIALDHFSALHTDLLVHFWCPAVIGVPLDFDEHALRIGLEVADHLVEACLRLIRQCRLVERDIALILAQGL